MNEFISNYQVKLKRIRAYVQGKIFKDANEGYLRQDTFWIRSVSWSIIGTTILGISWLSFAKTEEIIVVPGKIVPIGDVKKIQMPMASICTEQVVTIGMQMVADISIMTKIHVPHQDIQLTKQ